MAGEADGGGSQREQRTSRVDVGAAPAGGTWLEPGGPGPGELRERGSWRPSRPALSGEFTPLSATGIHSGRARRGVRARLAAAAAALVALGALGFFWLRGASAPEGDQAVVPHVEVVKLTPPSGAAAQPPAITEPRVTPIVQPRAGEAEPESQASARASTSAPRAKPDPARPSPAPVPPRRASSGSSEHAATSREGPAEAEGSAAPEPGRGPAPERPVMAHGDDPWNPDSFGDRR
jgi:hypothetical protein